MIRGDNRVGFRGGACPWVVGCLVALLGPAGCAVSANGLGVGPGEPDDGGASDGAEAPDTGLADHPGADGGGPADRDAQPGLVADRSPPPPADAPPPLGLGTPCSVGGPRCASGFCVDGVCCENACAGACQACSLKKTGAPGGDGLCRPVPAGMNPDFECPDEGVASCKHNGTCNGNGACALYASGIACGAPSCVGSTLTAAAACDGAGTCAPRPPGPCAGGLVCANNRACKSTCATDADCVPPAGCDPVTRSCSVLKKAQGDACAASAECATNFCADGVCCNLPCTGRCRACVRRLTGVDSGTCSSIQVGLRPTRPAECPMQAASTCGNTGLCDGAGGCQQHPEGTECGDYCCGPLGTGLAFCRLLCQAGTCSDRSNLPAGTCAGSPGPCGGGGRCETVGTGHICLSACTAPNSCCCVGGGIGAPMCTNPSGCVDGLGGHCFP